MKKIFITLVFSFAVIILFAQTKPVISVNAGVNCNCATNFKEATTESWDEYLIDVGSPDRVSMVDIKMPLGINIGINVNFPLNGKWRMQPGIHFNQKGAKAEGTYGTGSAATSFGHQEKFTYINIISPFQYWFNDNLYLDLGPEFGLMLARKYKETEAGMSAESSSMEDFKKFEIGLGGGVGYVFGKTGFGIFAKYTYGLTKVDVSEPYYEKVRNNVRQIGFFYRLPSSK